MPELPEVQTVVNDLNAAGVPGRTITAIDIHWHRTVAPHEPNEFCSLLEGKRIQAIDRRAKYIRWALHDGTWVYGHLRMSGRLGLHGNDAPRNKHEHLVFHLDDGRELRFHDTRKFGRWLHLANPAPLESRLGIEPLSGDFTLPALQEILGATSRKAKVLLLDQSRIAGLGNIYVDEALWEAQIHPETPANRIPDTNAEWLWQAIPIVLERGLRNLGTSLGTGKANFYSVAARSGRNQDELRVFRRTGLPCPRCGTAISKLVVGQRGTHICTNCQKKR